MTRPKFLKPTLIFSRPISLKPKPSKNWHKSQNQEVSIPICQYLDVTCLTIWLCLTIWRDMTWLLNEETEKSETETYFFETKFSETETLKNWQKSQNRGVPGSFETDMSISGRDLFDNLTLFVNWLCLTISRAPFAQTILPAAWARSRWTPSTMSRRCRSWTKPLTSLASSGEHKFLIKFGWTRVAVK